MKDKIGQGTIIYGAKSNKYPEYKCYSIIISARCDVANSKIDKVYYLTALDAEEWFCTKKGFDTVYYKELKCTINSFLKEQRINIDVLSGFSEFEQTEVICGINKKNQQKILDFFKCNDLNVRRKLVRENSKIGVNFLKNIAEAKNYHFFFLPELAYLNNKKRDKGLIVDLQEIDYYLWDDIENIKSPGIDMMILDKEKNKNKMARWKDIFWLMKEDDFVGVESTIISPWCELLMQRFAMDFIRIGVDGACAQDFEKILERI